MGFRARKVRPSQAEVSEIQELEFGVRFVPLLSLSLSLSVADFFLLFFLPFLLLPLSFCISIQLLFYVAYVFVFFPSALASFSFSLSLFLLLFFLLSSALSPSLSSKTFRARSEPTPPASAQAQGLISGPLLFPSPRIVQFFWWLLHTQHQSERPSAGACIRLFLAQLVPVLRELLLRPTGGSHPALGCCPPSPLSRCCRGRVSFKGMLCSSAKNHPYFGVDSRSFASSKWSSCNNCNRICFWLCIVCCLLSAHQSGCAEQPNGACVGFRELFAGRCYVWLLFLSPKKQAFRKDTARQAAEACFRMCFCLKSLATNN